ncbi:FxSxx-COOH system tetratricopeptide repeat protein [Cryptosporangium arvum]|uniref:NB-ARC domain protein n=1 Tax=Cryptosporangium arvum DSM 44712 TaxID=927661 RepID=A0A010ZKR5_9ACTN|nr:FxSxx-COOH system tetratricopeptide repeat protein [Cryptosporangium arvum]EXG79234.1 NB-ARC domain protein [Cryptosporangium arvum DSM 44712]
MGGVNAVGGASHQSSVFVSYTAADRKWAEWIAWAIEADEALETRAYLQDWDSVPGTAWVEWVDQVVRECDQLVAVCSPSYPGSSAVGTAEWQAVWARDPSGSDRRVVPVVVQPCDLKGLLAGRSWINLAGLDVEEARTQLVDGLRAARDGRAKPHSEPAYPGTGAATGRSIGVEQPDFPGALPGVFNVRRANPRFTGREGLLDRLHKELSTVGRVTVAAVRGLGGVGKTETAVEYCHRQSSAFDVVWWIDAEDPTAIPGQLAELGAALGLPEATAGDPLNTAAAVKATLGRRDRWLLVFDNAEDPYLIENWVPSSGTGQVLVTTRRSGFRSLGTVLEIAVWDRAESITFLVDRCPHTDMGSADRLAHELGDLPLGLEQAAAYMDTEDIGADRYLTLWESASTRLLGKGRVRGHAHTVATVWQLSVERIASVNPAALQLFRTCSLLAAQPIPLELFTAADAEWAGALSEIVQNPVEFNDAVGALASYSLVAREIDTVRLHRLVAATTREKLDSADLRRVHDDLLQVLRRIAPQQVRSNPNVWHWWRLFLPHVLAAVMPVLAEENPDRDSGPVMNSRVGAGFHLGNLAGAYLFAVGQSAESIWVSQQILTSSEKKLGNSDRITLGARNNLASAYQAAGRVADAIQLLEQVSTETVQLLGADDPGTLTARNNLAAAYQSAGWIADSVRLLEQVLESRRRVLGDLHPETLRTSNNLAHAYMEANQPRKTIAILEPILSMARNALPRDHPDILIYRDNLAAAYLAIKRPAESIEMFQEVLEDKIRVLGREHPDTFNTRNNLAHAYKAAGLFPEAAEMFRLLLADQLRVLGDEHPQTLMARNNLAGVYQDEGKWNDAVVLLEQVVDEQSRLLGEHHPHTLVFQSNLGGAYQRARRFDDAIRTFEYVLSARQGLLGERHPKVFQARRNLAVAYQAAGRVDVATTLFQQILFDCERNFGILHPLTRRVREDLAGVPDV